MFVELERNSIEAFIESFLREENLDSLAALIYGPHAGGYADEKTAVNILIIVESSKPILKHYSRRFGSVKTRLLIADRKTFEKDVENEGLGGILADILMTPYEPIFNEEYLWRQEAKFKKRVADSILRNLILSFPEMSREFIIKPEYLMFESMRRRASLFPLIIYRFLNVTRSDVKERNYALIMRGFTEALKELASEGKIQTFNDTFKISEDYVKSFLRKKIAWRFTRLFKNIRISILRHVLRVLPSIVNPFLDEYRIYRKHVANFGTARKIMFKLEDPRKYIFVPTSSGITPFTEKITIEEFLKKHMSQKHALKHEIKRLGGVLNSVYLLRISGCEKEERIVIKIFKDWYGWKWFPLALWTLGTRDFAILGKSRLEREYALNNFLLKNGINVPKIVYVAPEEKLLFREFIEGTSLSKMIKLLFKSGENSDSKIKMLKIIRQVGGEMARVHSLGVATGDCKPENILLSSDGRIFFLDLEQAERGGDQSWDIAEFLYYLGHYAQFSLPRHIEEVVNEFIEGYLELGGRVEVIKRALSPRYIKVFGLLVSPHIIFAISDACRKILKSGRAHHGRY
ncbi:MAG: lipopolysaccharide kinase InaA family protein [Candidatus Bathyarchaeia archaeon]